MKLLLSHGADVNKTDLEGRTALIAAAYMGHTEIVNHLLDHGADIDHADSDGMQILKNMILILIYLYLKKLFHIIKSIKITLFAGRTALAVAALCSAGGEAGRGGCAQLLLERGAAPARPDKDGMTPLLVAAFEGHK